MKVVWTNRAQRVSTGKASEKLSRLVPLAIRHLHLGSGGSMSEFELQQGIKNTKAYTAAIGKCGFDRVRAVADGA